MDDSPRRRGCQSVQQSRNAVAEGYLSYVLELRQLFPTYEEAYEELEPTKQIAQSLGIGDETVM